MLSFNELCSILCKRYGINAAEARQNVSLNKDCGFHTREIIQNEKSFNKWLDEMEELGK